LTAKSPVIGKNKQFKKIFSKKSSIFKALRACKKFF